MVNTGRLIPDLVWIAIALYGLYIQGVALRYARKNFHVSRPFGTQSAILLMAHARLRSNFVRMSIVSVNLAIGFLALIDILNGKAPPLSPIALLISIAFVFNEVALLAIAQLEVNAFRRLKRNALKGLE